MVQIDNKIVWVMLCTLVSNSAYGLVAPFLPPVFKAKGVTGGQVGLVIGIYSVAVMLCSPFLGRIMKQAGNINMIAIGTGLMGMAFVCFGWVERIENSILITVVGLVLRFLQGTSSACVQTSCYSIATNDYPKSKE